MVPFKEVWPWNEFEGIAVLFSSIRLKGEVNFFIREFLEVFYSPVPLEGYTLKACWSRLENMSWRRLEDVWETNKMFTGDICI